VAFEGVTTTLEAGGGGVVLPLPHSHYSRYFHLKLRLRMAWPGQELAASQRPAKRSWRAVRLRMASSCPLICAVAVRFKNSTAKKLTDEQSAATCRRV